MPGRIVTGVIRFAQPAHLPAQTKAYVRVLDVTMADAPARNVGEQVLDAIAAPANSGQAIRFSVAATEEDPRHSYILAVHVDADGDGQVGRGDFLTMQSYPVLTYGYPDRVDVQVNLVE